MFIDGTIFNFMDIIFPIFFLLVLGIIFVNIFRNISTWHKNNQSPKLSVEAIVVSKRTSITHYNNNDDHMGTYTTTSTDYYVTFEVESKDRLEFHVSGAEYGLLVEGDCGKLTFQGTRYLNFERNK